VTVVCDTDVVLTDGGKTITLPEGTRFVYTFRWEREASGGAVGYSSAGSVGWVNVTVADAAGSRAAVFRTDFEIAVRETAGPSGQTGQTVHVRFDTAYNVRRTGGDDHGLRMSLRLTDDSAGRTLNRADYTVDGEQTDLGFTAEEI
jgi:hypothetical protein